MRRRHVLAIALGLAALAPAAGAAPAAGPVALRPFAVVDDPVVRLGDLFEGIPAEAAALPLGPAPAPGRRSVIEAPLLAAIAQRHRLPWRPLGGEERAVIERPGRPVPREEILALIRGELIRHGLEETAEIDILGFAPPLVPPAAPVRLAVEAAAYDAATARFAVTLAVEADGMPLLRQRLAGRAVATVPVVVATRRLAVGEVVGPGDARLVRLRAERVRPGAAQRLDQVVGQQLRRPIAPEVIFAAADLGPPEVIRRNAPVLMLLDAPGLALTAQGRALESAALGAVVPVMNLASRAVVQAEAIGPGRVRVLPGAVPVMAAR
ncbi:flagellar basal body P-ring formation chaperone FlgA [Caldovatus aquaticus]|uniref:Flagellar basal body P-ring formation chaperone FlgA n=1 Tax=Caldovatus aquaticus TaxID=2865671 RepID=A0ABS7F6K3_9PROT|nr:flagellar basal body P-ring formation chaperone FlgA [Caldovatus aquaticus]MBW8271248.1 flagellar basal body P-ring formation chaperone FlgA [Caldovatus aquaticus]